MAGGSSQQQQQFVQQHWSFPLLCIWWVCTDSSCSPTCGTSITCTFVTMSGKVKEASTNEKSLESELSTSWNSSRDKRPKTSGTSKDEMDNLTDMFGTSHVAGGSVGTVTAIRRWNLSLTHSLASWSSWTMTISGLPRQWQKISQWRLLTWDGGPSCWIVRSGSRATFQANNKG